MRFLLNQDHDGHWYVIPEDNLAEWNSWLAIPSDDERSWSTPKFAEPVGGSPTLVRFESYVMV